MQSGLSNKVSSQFFHTRMTLAKIGICLFFVILLSRLTYLQWWQYERYHSLAVQNQIRLLPIPAPRGLIFDRHGTLIADNRPSFQLSLKQTPVLTLEEALKRLKNLGLLTENELTPLNPNRIIKNHLSEDEMAIFALHRYELPDVELNATLDRHYPHGPLFAHVLGYIGEISEQELKTVDPIAYRGTPLIGKMGVEKVYESTLHGITGYQQAETNAEGKIIRTLSDVPPIPGKSIILTLDASLQKVAFDALGTQKGAVVALNPSDGSILALVSTPSFDPNGFARGLDTTTYQALRNDANLPLFNRVLQGQYPPASTIKPLVALLALRDQVVTPQFSIVDPGWFQLGAKGRRYRDWKEHGHGTVDLKNAIIQSCDTYYYRLASKMSGEALSAGLQSFGYGEITDIDLSHERAGFVPTPQWKQQAFQQPWYGGENLNLVIGQGYLLATPLQMAQMAALLANQGTQYQPHVLDHIQGQEAPEPQRLRSLTFNPNHWHLVLEAMRGVVEHPSGTAHYLKSGTTYSFAGKTGTSQVFSLKSHEKYRAERLATHLHDHSLFIAFAPIENPQIAIAVIVENSKGAPKIAKAVLDAYCREKCDVKP